MTQVSSTPSSAEENRSPKLKVAIAGGGIAGLTTAIALRQHPGVDVQVYERSKELREIGASIGIGPNGLSSLDKLGVENALSGDILYRQKSGWPIIYRHWKTGEMIDHDTHHDVTDKKHFTARYHRAHLHRALYENLPEEIVHFGKTIIGAQDDAEKRVRLDFADGSFAEADILIGADGIRSVIRKTFVPSFELKWSGWVALRTVYEKDNLGDLEFEEDASHWIGHDRHIFHSPLGKGLFTIVGGYHADPNDPDAPGHDVRWDDEGNIEDFRKLYEGWHPTIQAFTQAAPNIRQFPNYTGPPLEKWTVSNRVTLVGDAAHGHGGAFASGGSLAINDAHALLLALKYVWPPSSSEDITIAQIQKFFELYETTRKPHVSKLQNVVRKSVAGQKAKSEDGKRETDGQLRTRVLNRMDPAWIGEHDVEARFAEVISEENGKGK